MFNLTLEGHAEAVRFVKSFGLPLLVSEAVGGQAAVGGVGRRGGAAGGEGSGSWGGAAEVERLHQVPANERIGSSLVWVQVLGGGGYTKTTVARAWTMETGVGGRWGGPAGLFALALAAACCWHCTAVSSHPARPYALMPLRCHAPPAIPLPRLQRCCATSRWTTRCRSSSTSSTSRPTTGSTTTAGR